MMRFITTALALLVATSGIYAAPAGTPASPAGVTLDLRETPDKRVTTRLTTSEISTFSSYTQLARAAYCAPKSITKWNCGQACTAVLGFNVTLNGGDGNGVQFYYIGTWPEKKSIAVAHQGTDPTKFMSLLTDIDFIREPLNTTLFPGAPKDAWVHGGFSDAHGDTGSSIIAEVKRLMKVTGYTSVTTVGHSLGGAIAELDALMLRLNLPTSTTVKSVVYGVPRVGNAPYAAFFDSSNIDFTRVNNDDDVIPIVPGRGLGFSHVGKEVHMLSSGYAVGCSGRDNAEDELCQIKSVPTVFQGNIINHLGPYEGVFIGTPFCY